MHDPPAPCLLLDGGGAVLMASAAAARLVGRSSAELEGRPLADLLAAPAPAVVSAFVAGMADAAAPAAPQRLAGRLRTGSGGELEVDLTLRRLAPAGAPGGAALLVEVHPLGPEGRVERAAGEALWALAATESASADAALVCRNERIVHAGEGLAGLLGLEPRSLTGWSIKNLVDPEDLLRVVDILRGVEAAPGAAAEFGFRLLRRGGLEELEVAARARRVAWMGSPAVLVGLRDISAALRATRAAAERITRLDAALAAADAGILILGEASAGSPVLFAGPPLQALLGVDPSRWTGRPFTELWAALRGAHLRPQEEERSWTDLLQDAEAVRADSVTLAGPPERTLERFSAPMKDGAGRIIGRVCAFRDVTVRRRAEAELLASREEARRAREELESLHEELRLANEGLERRMAEAQRLNRELRTLDEMRTNLLANVTHELQTPLISVKGFTEMILKGRLGAVTQEQDQGLRVALRNVDRLIGMIQGLLEFARGAASAPLALASFPLDALVAEAMAMVGPAAETRGITLRRALPEREIVVRADREQILQALVNLLANAVKYNRDGGEVAVEAARGRRGTAKVEVRDAGVGIPKEELERIFDRFQRGASGEGREGTGLGLAITRDILRRHGCTIRADSEPGKGSVFTFTLPLELPGRPEPSGDGGAEAVAPGRRPAVIDASGDES